MDDEFPNPTQAEIKAKLAERMRKRDESGLKADASQRRVAEQKQRKNVNGRLLRTQTSPQREPWTFRVRPDLKVLVEDLAEDLSKPGAKMTVAGLMEEAMQLVLTKYRGKPNGGTDA